MYSYSAFWLAFPQQLLMTVWKDKSLLKIFLTRPLVGEGGAVGIVEKSFFFFLFLAAKENNYVSCELSFPCIFSPPFWCSHILCYMGLLYFKLWSWCVMLFWATRALVNIFFPVCHRGHHWKLCIGPQNTKLAGICSQRPAGWIFFPFSMIAFVLWVMYFLTFLPLFKEIWKTILSSRIKSSFCVTSFLMPSPLVLRILIINL